MPPTPANECKVTRGSPISDRQTPPTTLASTQSRTRAAGAAQSRKPGGSALNRPQLLPALTDSGGWGRLPGRPSWRSFTM